MPTSAVFPTLVPTPTPLDLTPRVEATVNANVRQGDSVSYPVVGALPVGEQATIIGISTTGSGWYQIRLAGGGAGWISPSVVRVSGDVRSVPNVVPPPPPPPTQTPVPTLPPAAANLVIDSISLDPAQPRCAETFTIRVRIRNAGSGPSQTGGTISLQDLHVSSGTVTGSTIGTFPPLGPDQSYDLIMRLTVSAYYQETHRITVIVDSQGQVPETSEVDNVGVVEYSLRRAACS